MKNLQLTFTFTFILSIASSQSELMLTSCNDLFFEINNSTSNPDAPCSRDITLEQIASYTTVETCAEGLVNWLIYVDLWNDGTYDLEYNSSLPSSDMSLDDTNGNSVPDLYVSPTLNNEVLNILLNDIEGSMSEHSVYWQAEDECGVEINCTQTFRIIDSQSPIPYCVSLSSYILNSSDEGNTEVCAADFNIGSFDNCTPQDELRFSFSGNSIVSTRAITCDDVINSPVSIDMYVWDNKDNVDYCSVYLSVIPGPTFDCFPFHEVNGFVKTENDKPIQNAEVILNCDFPEYPKSEFTDANGYYSFGNVLGSNPGCYLTVDKEDEFITSVTTLDLVKIVRHILGLQSFTSPYQLIASDVTGDEKIKASDLIMHRKLILGVVSEFTEVSPWAFLDDSYQFDDPNYPWLDLEDVGDSPYQITLSSDLVGPFNFVGVKIGNIVD